MLGIFHHGLFAFCGEGFDGGDEGLNFICVKNPFKGGVGAARVLGTRNRQRTDCIHHLPRKRNGYRAILIYGDPEYYKRFGFVPAERFGIGSAVNMYMDALQALELWDGALSGCQGRFFEDAVYDIDTDATAEFDKGFPEKELRDDLPHQERFRYQSSLRRPRK